MDAWAMIDMLVFTVAASLVVTGVGIGVKRHQWLVPFAVSILLAALAVILPYLHVAALAERVTPRDRDLTIAFVLALLSLIIQVRTSTWRRIKSISRMFRPIATLADLVPPGGRGRGHSWEWKHGIQTGAQEALWVDHLPPIQVVGYTARDLSRINVRERLDDQLAIFHVIEQREYVSWVDAAYWALLRRLAREGIRVTVFIQRLPGGDPMFEKYVRAIVGPHVRIDDSLFERVQLRRTNRPSTPRSTAPPAESEVAPYYRLGAFARLAPLLMARRHVLILLWERHRDPFDRAFEAISPDLHFPVAGENDKEIDVTIRGYLSGTLVFPTYTDVRGETLAPGETYCLGMTGAQRSTPILGELRKDELATIAADIIAPLLPVIHRGWFRVIARLLLVLRRLRFAFALRMIASLFAWGSRLAHRRLGWSDA